MKLSRKALFIFILALLFCSTVSYAQNAAEDDQYKPVDFSLQLKNMHLWRGIQVTNTTLSAVTLKYKDRGDNFNLGVWGGAGFTGEFREFNYYASYSKNGFKVALGDIFNFNKPIDENRYDYDLFNYRARSTRHFIDLSVAYRFQGNFPLNISWATIIAGRDRGLQNEKNLYTTYVSADYPILKDQPVDVSLGLAGAFALNPENGSDAHFYGHKPGIVNINMIVSKKIQLGSYTIPVSVMPMWNPVEKHGNIEVAVNLF